MQVGFIDRRPTRTGHFVVIAAVVLGAFVLSSCGDDGTSEVSSAPATDLDGQALDGQALYAQSCASCHGADLAGTDRGPSHLSIVYEPNHHPDESFRRAISDGVGAHHWNFGDMPPVSGLTDAEVDAIIAYVREQQDARGFEP